MIYVFVSLLAFHHFLEQVSRICLSFSLPSLFLACSAYLSLFQPSITFSSMFRIFVSLFSLPSLFLACSAYLFLFQPSINFSSMFRIFVSLLAFHHFFQHVPHICLSFSLPSLFLACSACLSLFQPSITFSTCSAYLSLFQHSITFSSMFRIFVSLLAFHHFFQHVPHICLSFSLPSLSLHVPHICLSFSLPSLSLHVPHICLSISLPSLSLACSKYLSLFQPSITFST